MRKGMFSTYHPAVIFLYFMAVVIFTFATLQPAYVGITILVVSAYSIFLRGWRAFGLSLRLSLPLLVLITVANPLFNSLGTTVLFTAFGNTITFEALAYGACAGGMLVAVVAWFSCYSAVMENDKFLFLFGRVMPTLTLVISMIFRFIPHLVTKGRAIHDSQIALFGEPVSGKEKTAQAIRMASVLMGLGMEDSIETADSMRARGYGSSTRTTYADYVWETRDMVALSALLVLMVLNGFLVYVALAQWAFFPSMPFLKLFWWGYVPYFVLLLFPLLVEVPTCIR